MMDRTGRRGDTIANPAFVLFVFLVVNNSTLPKQQNAAIVSAVMQQSICHDIRAIAAGASFFYSLPKHKAHATRPCLKPCTTSSNHQKERKLALREDLNKIMSSKILTFHPNRIQ